MNMFLWSRGDVGTNSVWVLPDKAIKLRFRTVSPVHFKEMEFIHMFPPDLLMFYMPHRSRDKFAPAKFQVRTDLLATMSLCHQM
jgi:hypothetical protein